MDYFNDRASKWHLLFELHDKIGILKGFVILKIPNKKSNFFTCFQSAHCNFLLC